MAPSLIIIKIALIGDGAVGKTALRERFIGSSFDSSYYMTIGADFAIHTENIDGDEVKFQVWDLAGQQRFASVRPAYYSGVVGCILVYDITRKETFDSTPLWIKEVFKNSGHGHVPIVLLGNKIDLRDQVSSSLLPKHGLALKKEINNVIGKNGYECKFFETSALTGENVSEAFIELGRSILSQNNQKVTDDMEKGTLTTL